MSNATSQEGIAIIGMAGRFPKARNVTEFWRLLRDGVDAITFFSDKDLKEDGFNFCRNNNESAKARGLLEDADKFDAAFFGINSKEAEIMDPQHRVFLECAWEALEDAGYDTEREDRPIGVFAAMSMNTYLLSNLISNPELMNLVGSYHMMLANDKDFLPTRVSYKLNLRGPSMAIQTACSSSLVAVSVACQHLATHQCDLALAGAVSIMFPQKKGHVFEEGGIASPDGRCRAFDAQAQGTVPGEGVGIVVLKRLADALADGDEIDAVIKGFAVNNDGGLKAGYTAPSEDGQAECIALAQALAGVEPESIQHVVTHGTGTPLGDPIEVAGLAKAFRAGTQAKGFCALTSVKSNVGHSDVAAGMAGLIAAVLSLKHKQIPPSLYFEQPNPKIDFASSPFYVNTRLTDWKRGATPRRAGVSSFGIGGTNSHVVLEEAPDIEQMTSPAEPQLLLLSTRTPTALENATATMAEYLRDNATVSLGSVAWTLQTGRRQFSNRRCLVASTPEEAKSVLRGDAPTRLFGRVAVPEPLVTFMFPGQGAQQVGMGRGLYERSKHFRDAIDECAELLRPQIGRDIRTLLYPSSAEVEAAAAALQETRFTQPALFATSYALARFWIGIGVRPESMIGHSIGEYVAAVIGGTMQLFDALRMVAARGALMQQMPAGSMLAIRAAEADVRPHLTEQLDIAAVNSPTQCVVSGPSDAVTELEDELRQQNIAAQMLRTSHAFHSQMMEPMLEQFAAVVGEAKLAAPKLPFISNVSGTWITAEQAIDPHYWVRHLRGTVQFAAGVAELLGQANRVFLEVGPGQTLTGLARQQAGIDRTVVPSLGRATATDDEYRAVLEAIGQLWLNGALVNWSTLHNRPRRRVHLPTYPFERKRYWVQPGKHGQNTVETLRAAENEVNGDWTTTGALKGGSADGVLDRLRALFSNLSGVPLNQLRNDVTFTEIGLESLFLSHATQAIEREFAVKVPFSQLVEQYSTLNSLAAHLQSLRPAGHVSATVSHALLQPDGALHAPTLEEKIVPLTEAQREIWYETERSESASSVFNETCCIEFKGGLDLDALHRAVQKIVDRHEALRASIDPAGNSQTIRRSLAIDVERLDWSHVDPANRAQLLDELLAREAGTAFDLARGPLVRFTSVSFDRQTHALVFTGHHLVCDGGSMTLIVRELGQLYTAESQYTTPDLPAAHPFSEFAADQKRKLNSPERAAAEQYWMKQFETPVAELELPQDFPRPAQKIFRAGQAEFRINRELTEELKRFSGQQGATLFTTLFSAYSILLCRLSGQEDLVVGVPASGRATNLSDRLVGHCVNFLPIRLRVRREMPFTECLASIRRRFIEAYDHQSYTFGSLVQRLALPRMPNRMPLLSVTFNLEKNRGALDFGNLDVRVRANHRVYTNVDLTFDVIEDDGELAIECTYCADIFRPDTIARWLGHYETLLRGLVTRSSQRVSEFPLLNPAEWRQAVIGWNQTAMEYPRDAQIHELFEAQVERTPEAVAAVVGRQEITYRELNRRANQVAHHLRHLGAGPEVLVALSVERSIALLVGALGILKAGAAYVPVDWTYPAERVRFMLEDTAAPILLTQQSLLGHLPETNMRVVCVDRDWEQIAECPTANLSRTGSATNLAYVIYTSGSTGTAKGVAIEHRSVVSFLHWARGLFPASELAGVLASTSICFDLSVFELFVPLSWGGCVILAENAAEMPPSIPGRPITLVNTVPSAIKDLLHSNKLPASVSVVNLAGEKLTPVLVRELYSRPHIRKVYDLYGPSEATTYATWALRTVDGPATVGKPISNTQVYILDTLMHPCPIGVAGEVYIGGDSLARGYINRPELTAEKFIPNPFRDEPGARLYRTGDVARYLPDGNIEFIGRGDHQVKIRGYRIELGEIETILNQHPAVRDCVAVVREDSREQKQIAAYLVPEPGFELTAGDVRRFLRERLPDYMIPAVFVNVPELPLMPNGKVDRGALPDPNAATLLTEADENTRPRTPVEQALIEIWRDVLHVDQIGVNDDFFDLGGHSVLVTQITSRVRQLFQVDLSLRHMFGAPTVATLAQVIELLLEEHLRNMSEAELRQLAAEAIGKEAE